MTTAAPQCASTSIKCRTLGQRRASIKSTRPAKVAQRPRNSAVEVLKVSITTLPHSDQLKLLTEIADSDLPRSINNNLGRMEKHIGGDIKLVAKAQARKGTSLRSQQLIDVALKAVVAGPLCDATRKASFSTLGQQAPEIQRGKLHAMRIFQDSRIAQEVPDVAADALLSLLTGSQPRSRCATQLLDLFDQRLDDFEKKYERREKILIKRFESLGIDQILKPALSAEYPKNAKRQRQELDEIRDGDNLHEEILACCAGLRVLEQQGQKLDPEVLAVVDELELINQALGHCAADEVETAALTMAEDLNDMLCRQLPTAVQAQLTGLLATPDSAARTAKIKALLRAPMTSPEQLIGSLKSDAEVFEALQILWGGVPVYSLRFARNLSEMLLITNAPSRLLQDVESKLLGRLGPEKLGSYAVQRLRETRKVKPDDEPRSQLVVDAVMRVMTPPSKDKGVDRKLETVVKMQTGRIKTSLSQDQLATERRKILAAADYAVTPAARPHQDMLAWLEVRKSQALKIEAAHRPANPMPRPRLDRRNARARLFDGAKLKPKLAAAIPQVIPVQAVPVQAVRVQVQAVPVQAVPVQAIPVQAIPVQAIPVQAIPVQAIPVQAVPVQVQAVPVQADPALVAKRKLKRRFVRATVPAAPRI